MKKVAAIFLLSVVIFSCKKDTNNSVTTTDPSIALESMNAAYGTDPQQQMDLYLPPNRNITDTRVLVMIHGGAWIAGDKADLKNTFDSIKSKLPDFAIFDINYRLANPLSFANIWPTQINDVHAAFEFIKSKAAYYVINPTKMAVLGTSAGGHLALLEAYQNNSSGSIKAVVDLFGPTDMKDIYNNQDSVNQFGLQIFLSGTPTSNPVAYTNASPLYSVNISSPATIIFHGTADTVVHISESDSLYNRLSAYSTVHKIYRYTGEYHGWSGANLVDTYTKSTAFLQANVK